MFPNDSCGGKFELCYDDAPIILYLIDFKILEGKFDIIFLDPPYRENNLSYILNTIFKNKILKKEGIIIIHRHKKQKDNIPYPFKIIEEKKYGISKISFFCLLS